MGPFTLAVDVKSSSSVPSDTSKQKIHNLQLAPKKFFAAVSAGDEKPFDFFRTFFEGVIAGGTAGVVVETVLYPIDTIKTRLQAAQGGGKIVLKGLYSGLAGNIAGVLPASGIFVGVYEPTKQKLLKTFPDKLSAVAHLVRFSSHYSSYFSKPFQIDPISLPASSGKPMKHGQFCSGTILGQTSRMLNAVSYNKKYCELSLHSILLQNISFGTEISLMDHMFASLSRTEYLRDSVHINASLPRRREVPSPLMIFCFRFFSSSVETTACIRLFTVLLCCLLFISSLVGAVTGALTTPLDVIKTRLMIQGSTNQYKGIFDCVQTVVREEGPRALLKGIGPRVLWIGIGGSVFFGVLESTKRFLAERRPNSHPESNSKQE
ncbi:S-adenosylmethionine carrier 1, chloroplastic/mitochondrial-like [Olea europaea var. sylvestris]|uniref:S-adenosylmethionine carrier 1, chloroplastic/mitochondrial-like n=1 Tax=Olea europaea var. sylvestris TaxID=158386 RepID=UPI000C1D2997|nr:S-adenosylmethionine carrier 1, chloroplastic/mitochondrial-like [Olea europaea var. sylvestris]